MLVAAKHLVNDRTIRIVPREKVSYYHFLFDAHQVVFAEGCPAESLYPGTGTLQSVTPEERDEIINLFPELDDRKVTTPLTDYALRAFEALSLRRFG